MNPLVIKDLDFCQTEFSEQKQIRGSGNLNNVKWKGIFDFSFSHNRISSFSVGSIAAFAIAIGPVIIFTPDSE